MIPARNLLTYYILSRILLDSGSSDQYDSCSSSLVSYTKALKTLSFQSFGMATKLVRFSDPPLSSHICA